MKQSFLSTSFLFYTYHFESKHYTDNRHGISYHYLGYMVEGEGTFVTEKETMTVKKGDLFYLPKNLSYQSYWQGEKGVKFLSFGFANVDAIDFAKYEMQKVGHSPVILEELRNIPTNGSQVTCQSVARFYDILSKILPNLTPSAQSKDEILATEIKTAITKHPFSSLSEIASMCAISEAYLYTVFKKHTRTTPNTFRQQILCEKGAELLLTTDKSIEEISGELNFSSSSYFRKVFKKHMGMTPREIRKQA